MIKKLMKIIGWIIVNGLFTTCLLYGIYTGSTGLQNITLLFAWYSIIISFTFTMDVMKQHMLKKDLPSVPLWMETIYDVGIICILAYNGWWITAIGYIIHTIIMVNLHTELKELKKIKGKYEQT